MKPLNKAQGDADTPGDTWKEFWDAVERKDWSALPPLAVELAVNGEQKDKPTLMLLIATLAAKVPPEPKPKPPRRRHAPSERLVLGRAYSQALEKVPHGLKGAHKKDIAQKLGANSSDLDRWASDYKKLVKRCGYLPRGGGFFTDPYPMNNEPVCSANFVINAMRIEETDQTPLEELDIIDLIDDILGEPGER